MQLAYIFLIIGFVFLVKGADFFVSGSSSIARFFKIPSFIIGLTIVAFGTSAPEAAVSITAAFKGQNDIALGNVVGSNLFNLLAVVGICALIKPIGVKTSILAKEFPFSILATVALLLMGLDVFFGGGDSNFFVFLYLCWLLPHYLQENPERLLIWQMRRSLRKRPKRSSRFGKAFCLR